MLEECVARRLVDFLSNHIYSLQHSFPKSLYWKTLCICLSWNSQSPWSWRWNWYIIYLDLTRASDTVCHYTLLGKLKSLEVAGSQSIDLVYCLVQPPSPTIACAGWYEFNFPLGTPKQTIFWTCIKCVNIRISRKRKSLEGYYSLYYNNISVITSAGDLGVLISNDLLWVDHIHTIILKVNRILGFLNQCCSFYLPPSTQRVLYIALVRSHLTYASPVWSPSYYGSLFLLRNIWAHSKKAHVAPCKVIPIPESRRHLLVES